MEKILTERIYMFRKMLRMADRGSDRIRLRALIGRAEIQLMRENHGKRN
jgi:hypothetical protein